MGKILIGRFLQTTLDGVKAVLWSGDKGTSPEAKVTSTSIDANHQALDVAVVATPQALSAARTVVEVSAVDTLLLVANPSRRTVFIFNDSDAPLLVGFGTTPVSTVSFTLPLSAHSGLEMPRFSGQIRGYLEVGTGPVYITEMT